METVTRKNLRYNFEVVKCEATSKLGQSRVKACVKSQEKLEDVEFVLDDSEIVIGNEKNIYEKIDLLLKSKALAIA